MADSVKYSFTVVEHRCDQDGLVVFERVQTKSDFGTLPKKKRFYAEAEAIVPLPEHIAGRANARIREPYSVDLPVKDVQAAFTMAEGALRRELANVQRRVVKRLENESAANANRIVTPPKNGGIIIPGRG